MSRPRRPSTRGRSRGIPSTAGPEPPACPPVARGSASTRCRFGGDLPVTRVATLHVLEVVDAVLFLQFRADAELSLFVGLALLALGLVGHAGDQFLGPEVTLRLAVAIEAPAHRQRRDLLNDVHLVDPAVAGEAADAVIHVGAVVEVNV